MTVTATVQTTRRIKIQATTRAKSGVVGGFNYVVGVGTKKFTVSATEPQNPKVGDIWVDTSGA